MKTGKRSNKALKHEAAFRIVSRRPHGKFIDMMVVEYNRGLYGSVISAASRSPKISFLHHYMALKNQRLILIQGDDLPALRSIAQGAQMVLADKFNLCWEVIAYPLDVAAH